MSKKITGVLLCMLMGVTLAACGNSSGTDNPKGQTTDQSEVSSQEKESLSDTQTGITADTELVSANIPDKNKIFDGDILFSWSATLEVMYCSIFFKS